MNTEERFKKDVWWLLQELKKDEMSTARSEHIHFEYTTGENKPTVDDQRRAIRLLTVTRSIDVAKDVYPFPFDTLTARVSGVKPSGHLLELRKPTFDRVYEVFEWSAQGKVDDKTTLGLAEFMSAGVSTETEEKSAPADTQKITPKLIWLDTLSDSNLERFKKVITITLEELEITGINRLTYNKIGFGAYERAGFSLDEVKKILGKIGVEENGIITVSNDELKKKIGGKEFSVRADNIPTKKDYLETLSLTEHDLDSQLIVRIPTLDTPTVLKNLKDYIDGKTRKPITSSNSSAKTPEQKQLCVLEKISAEFKLGVYSDGMVDIAASDFDDCGVDRSQLYRMIGKFQKEGLIKSFIFIDGSEAKYEEEYEYDVYRLWLPDDYMDRANLFLVSIADPNEYARFVDLQEQMEDMKKNPEKYRKQSEERNRIRKEHVEKIYSSIDYADPVEKTAWQMKWSVVQLLWQTYISNSKAGIIRIPIKEMTSQHTASQVSGILEGLSHEGCFHDWQIFKGNYDIYHIDKKIFPEIYGKVKDVIYDYSEGSIPSTQPTKTVHKIAPFFDEVNGHIFIDGKHVEIPLGSNQYVLCKKIFSQPLQDWTKETDIIDSFYKDGKRSFYDAVRLVNTKIKAELGIKEFLEYKASRTRIRPELLA
ncbi:MAG: hypothetical protein U0522_03195 [Candidatus Paceibacterota bacterium]